MANSFAIFSGLSDTADPPDSDALNFFCQFNDVTNNYTTSSAVHLRIDTPTFANYTVAVPGVPGAGTVTITMDGADCGSVYEQMVDQGAGSTWNDRQYGPAKRIGAGNTFPASPGKGYQLGVIKNSLYDTESGRIMPHVIANYPPDPPTILPSTFTSSLGGGGNQWNMSNASLQPGQLPNNGLVHVICPSTDQQPTTNLQGRRIHFGCNGDPGVLATLLRKLQATGFYGYIQYDITQIPLAADNAEAAARWLVAGYGIMQGTSESRYTEFQAP